MNESNNRVFAPASIMFGILLTLFLGCLFTTGRIQYSETIDREEEEYAATKRAYAKYSLRGDIVSSDMQTLCGYFPKYDILVDFRLETFRKRTIDTTVQNIDKNQSLDTLSIRIYKEFSAALAKFVGKKSSREYFKQLYNHRLAAERNSSAKRNLTIASDVDIFRYDTILKTLKARIPFFGKNENNIRQRGGIYSVERIERAYPFGNLAHSAIGIIRGDNDNVSLSGIENMYDDELKKGNTVVSTIDSRMQDVCETILRKTLNRNEGKFTAGTIVLMDVATGDIKAMANIGNFNDTHYKNRTDVINNALLATLDPGSTFKTVSLMLALETGKVKLSDSFDYEEGTKKQPAEHKIVWETVVDAMSAKRGRVNVTAIMKSSLNIGTAKFVHRAFGNEWNKYHAALKQTGILDSAGIEDRKPGVTIRNKYDMLHVSHGYQLRLAPIHILRFYNALANGGVMMKPRLVSGTVEKNGRTKIEPPTILGQICSRATADSIKKLLSKIIADGTKYGISGKTGTARMYLPNGKYENRDGKSRDLASFCGYFPSDEPKYSCMVVLYSAMLPKSETRGIMASIYALPVFRTVADAIYPMTPVKFVPDAETKNYPSDFKNTSGENLSVIAREMNQSLKIPDGKWFRTKPDDESRSVILSKMEFKKGEIPDVRGMGLRDAVYILEQHGMKTSYKGTGTVVGQTTDAPKRTVKLKLNND